MPKKLGKLLFCDLGGRLWYKNDPKRLKCHICVEDGAWSSEQKAWLAKHNNSVNVGTLEEHLYFRPAGAPLVCTEDEYEVLQYQVPMTRTQHEALIALYINQPYRYIEHRPDDCTLIRWDKEGIGARPDVIRRSTFDALQVAGVLKLEETIKRRKQSQYPESRTEIYKLADVIFGPIVQGVLTYSDPKDKWLDGSPRDATATG